MDKRFKRLLLLMIVIVIICIIIFLVIFFSKKSNKALDMLHGIPDPPEVMQTEDINKVIECKVTNEYFIVKKVITDYFIYCSNLNYKASDIDTFGHNVNKEELEKSAQKEREKSQEILYDMLDKEYINEFNIKDSDIITKYGKEKYTKSIIKKVLKFKNSNNVNTYYISGINIDDKEKKINEFQIGVSLDMLSKTFSIYPEEYLNKHNYDKLSIGDHIDGKNKEKIEKNNNNIFIYRIIKDNEIALEYFNNYKYLMINDEESAYEILDYEYKNSRFKNINNYKTFVSENKEILKNCIPTKYQVNGNEGNKEYICLDNFGNYYIFNQKNICKYSLYLDTYTIDTEEFLEKYNNSDEYKKAGINVEKFFEAVNMKDYSYIYRHLSNEFKNKNFQNEEELKNYLKDRLFVYNKSTYSNYDKEKDVIVFNVKVSDCYENKGEKNMTVVMKIENGTDYIMSFSLD